MNETTELKPSNTRPPKWRVRHPKLYFNLSGLFLMCTGGIAGILIAMGLEHMGYGNNWLYAGILLCGILAGLVIFQLDLLVDHFCKKPNSE